MKKSIKDIIVDFVAFAKINIAELAKKEIENEEKKAKLDKAMTAYLVAVMDRINLGFLAKFFINKFVINNIPVITQAIFDLIKAQIEGVTK